MHFATLSVHRLALWFNKIFVPLIGIGTGLTQQQIPQLRKCSTLGEILKLMSTKKDSLKTELKKLIQTGYFICNYEALNDKKVSTDDKTALKKNKVFTEFTKTVVLNQATGKLQRNCLMVAPQPGATTPLSSWTKRPIAQ